MAQTSLIIGDTNWAVKEDSLLGYNVIQNNYLPIPIDCVRATTATRVNEQGLIEIVPRNLLLYSEQFDNANWGKINATVTTNTTTAPNGTLTADKLIATAVNGTHLVLQIGAGAVLGQNLTLSVYAKSAGLTRLQFVNNGGGSGISSYDLTTGIATLSSGVSASMQDVGNGWYRCVLTFAPIATGNFNIQIRLLDSSGNSTFTGNDVDGIFAWGAQIDNGSVATEYFPTTNRLDIPRIDYSTGTASLLVEPQRTNLYTYSQQLNQWSIIGGITVTENDAISPDGTQNADRAQFTLSTDLLYRSGTGSAGSNTLTVYAKAKSGTSQKFRFFGNGGLSYSSDQVATNQWQRFTFTYTYSATTAGLAGATTGAGDVLFYGFQHEIGTYATSYIPTIASSVTRNADIISRTGISGLIGQTEGTVFVDITLPNTSANDIFTFNNSGVNDVFLASNGGNLLGRIYYNGNPIFFAQYPITSLGGRFKMLITYKSGNSSFYVNGTLLSNSTTSFAFTNTLSDVNLTNNFYAGANKRDYNSVQLYKTALTNAECIALTTI